jgi:CspA family cold shock protein
VGHTGASELFAEDDVAQGTIKKLVSDRGFGFIAQSDGSELFFHRSQVLDGGFDTLREGQAVTFEKGMDARRGKEQAEKVAPAPA